VDIRTARILVATALGKIIEPRLGEAFAPGAVTVAVDEAQIRAAVGENLRFDVVLTDLTWNDTAIEYAFDGLDVLDVLQQLGRAAPVLLAIQGHGIERDHLDEAMDQPAVAGVIRKAAGIEELITVLRQVAAGHTLKKPPPSPVITIHQYFAAGQRGETAARMAGAIASRRASNYDTLAAVTTCSRNTAIKLVDKYVGPLIRERREHPDDVPLTAAAVYRWCGEHSRYLVSWCRRHGHADVIGNVTQPLARV
jgi:CheY-like chemotaxis protein